MSPSSSSPFNGIFRVCLLLCLVVTWQLSWLESLLLAGYLDELLPNICMTLRDYITLHYCTADWKSGNGFSGKAVDVAWKLATAGHEWVTGSEMKAVVVICRVETQQTCKLVSCYNVLCLKLHLSHLFLGHQSLLSAVKFLHKICSMFTVLKLLSNLFKVSMVVSLKVKDLN